MRFVYPPLPLAVCVALACHDDRPHVYQAPPPPTARPAAEVPRDREAPAVAEAQIGTVGAEARILAVRDAATGNPVALTSIAQPIEVLTLVARGPGRPASETARIQLVMHGPEEAEQTLVLDAPAPAIVAHAFLVPIAGDGRTGLRAGRYTLQVRIVGGDGVVLASSGPVYVQAGP